MGRNVIKNKYDGFNNSTQNTLKAKASKSMFRRGRRQIVIQCSHKSDFQNDCLYNPVLLLFQEFECSSQTTTLDSVKRSAKFNTYDDFKYD